MIPVWVLWCERFCVFGLFVTFFVLFCVFLPHKFSFLSNFFQLCVLDQGNHDFHQFIKIVSFIGFPTSENSIFQLFLHFFTTFSYVLIPLSNFPIWMTYHQIEKLKVYPLVWFFPGNSFIMPTQPANYFISRFFYPRNVVFVCFPRTPSGILSTFLMIVCHTWTKLWFSLDHQKCVIWWVPSHQKFFFWALFVIFFDFFVSPVAIFKFSQMNDLSLDREFHGLSIGIIFFKIFFQDAEKTTNY